LVRQTVTYDVELNHLILPNQPLYTLRGIPITDLPYVMVELESDNSKNSDLILSNNRFIKSVTFIVPMNQTSSPFLDLKDTRMTQSMRINKSDGILMTIKAPDGSIIQFSKEDNYEPFEPDPKLQVVAIFSLLRNIPTGGGSNRY